MVYSSNVKSGAAYAVRMCVLLLLMGSAVVLTGCATVSPDDRAVFYQGWVRPNSEPLTQ
jgi:hypothetical protein